MSITIRLTGAEADRLDAPAHALLTEVSGAEPAHERTTRTEPDRKDLATTIAIVALVLSIPGWINSALDLAQRTRLLEWVAALLDAVKASDADAELQVEGAPSLDLRTSSVDAVVDLLLRQRGA